MTSPAPSERLGIVGSGAIACGLARLAADRLDTVLWARSEASADRARDRLAGAGTVVTEVGELTDRTIVVEAVTEDMAVKAPLLATLGALLPADSLVVSTTSSLSVAELAEASGRAGRFGALHVFNPVEKMKLVELAFPAQVEPATRERLTALCEALDRVAVEVPDTPGFVVNRLLFPYMFDAVRLSEQSGLEPRAIDTCMKLGAAHPMGPLALLDFIGLDVALAIGESIGADVPDRVRELVAAGRLGRKSGSGLYDYRKPSGG